MAQCKCGAINEYQEEPYTCRDCRRVPHTHITTPEMATTTSVKYEQTWTPDLDAIAAKEREILALVVDGKSDRDIFTNRRPDEFIRLRDELLVLKTDPAEIAAVRALYARIRRDQKELDERMQTMPKSIRDEVYGR